MELNGMRIGFAFTGSFCTILSALSQMKKLKEAGAEITPIFSYSVSTMDTRFVSTEEFFKMAKEISGRDPIITIPQAEPIGPKKLLDAVIIAPCTGNTMAKMAHGICDTPVLMAAKSHLRNGGPVVIAPATNDMLAANAQNLGRILNVKNVYTVPVKQDDPIGKPASMIAEMSMIPDALEAAFSGVQLTPIIL